LSICVCVLNFADDRRKFESDYQKANPLGDAPCSELYSLFQRFKVTLGDQFPASLFAGGRVTISECKTSSIGFWKIFLNGPVPANCLLSGPSGNPLWILIGFGQQENIAIL